MLRCTHITTPEQHVALSIMCGMCRLYETVKLDRLDTRHITGGYDIIIDTVSLNCYIHMAMHLVVYTIVPPAAITPLGIIGGCVQATTLINMYSIDMWDGVVAMNPDVHVDSLRSVGIVVVQ